MQQLINYNSKLTKFFNIFKPATPLFSGWNWSVELMKSRNRLFTKKESKKLKNNTDDIFLIDKKNKRYPIHKSLSNEEIIISNSEDISLLNDITYLKSIGLVNFAIDGRWRDKNYLNKIQEYNTAIDKWKIILPKCSREFWIYI